MTAPQTDCRTRTTSSKIQEAVTYLIGVGVLGILIQVGEYKANFANLCAQVKDLRYMFDAYASENKDAHDKINDKLADTRERVIRQADRRVVESR